VDKVPAEYEAKAIKADGTFGAPESTVVLDALTALPTVRGLALGVLSEFSESIYVLIEGMAHKSALENHENFGQNNYKAAFGKIHWWLKRRRAHLAAITAVESRHAALGYTGGTAQQQAAAIHSRAQAQTDWREYGAFRQREEETNAP
jgi:hypothetical protein